MNSSLTVKEQTRMVKMLGLRRSKMSTEITVDELKAVIASLNKVLDTKIKTIGKKRNDIIESFKSNVEKFIEEETTDQLPEDVIDFYNEYFAEEEEAEEEAKEEKKTTSKKTPAGKKTDSKTESKKTPAGKETKKADGKSAGKKENKKTPGKKDTKKVTEKKERGEGVVKKAVDAYMKKGIKTVGEIVKHLEKDFPGRNIKATVSHVVCVLNHVE